MIAIGPAVEVFLTAVGLILLVLFGIAFLTRPFWPRIITYFRRWHERDMRLEQQQREEAECRRRAQQEMREYCHDDILHPEAAPDRVQESGRKPSGQAVPVSTKDVSHEDVAEKAEPVQQIGSERTKQ